MKSLNVTGNLDVGGGNDWIYCVIDFIESNITQPISLEELAALSGYSPRHFQRLFREKTSENVMDYVRGRRLTLAMEDIVKAETSIIDIAFKYQFESQQSFTRAFRARFTFPPVRFRNHSVINPPSSKQRLTPDYLRMIENNNISLEPEITKLDGMMFAGMSAVFDINSYGNPSTMSEFRDLVIEFRQRKQDIGGTALDSAEYEERFLSYRVPKTQRKHRDGIVLMAAVQVETASEIPSDMDLIKTPPANFAKFEYRGGFEGYPLAGYYITGCWFPRSKYWIGNAPVISDVQRSPSNERLHCFLPLRSRHPKLIDQWWH